MNMFLSDFEKSGFDQIEQFHDPISPKINSIIYSVQYYGTCKCLKLYVNEEGHKPDK